MLVSKQKTNACIIETTRPKKKNGKGRSKGDKLANAVITLWSPIIFPANRIPREKGLTNKPIPSIGKKSGARNHPHQDPIGLAKCPI